MFQTCLAIVNRSLPHRQGFVVFAALLVVTAAGCSSDSAESKSKTQKAKSSSVTDAEQCRQKLAVAMSRLSADRMATAVDADRGVAALNAWVSRCGSSEITTVELDAAAMKMLNENPRVTAQRFTDSDGFYVRDCLLLRDLSNEIISRIKIDHNGSNREEVRVMAIFQWVTRHISLAPKTDNDLPLNLYDTLMLGKGSPEHRAWLFAELLRQQQVDAVWVTPSENSDGRDSDGPDSDETESIAAELMNQSNAMVVVLQGDQTWVFDCEAGIPLPAADGLDLLNPSSASLKTLIEHDRWKSAKVQLIAQANTFAPRMLILQDNLASSDAAILYEELNGSASQIRPILQRISDGSKGAWVAADLTVWPFPEVTSIASRSLPEDKQQQLTAMMQFFDAPFERSVKSLGGGDLDTFGPQELTEKQKKELAEQRLKENFERLMDNETATSEDKFGKPSKKLLMARVRQISGDLTTPVIRQLQQVRIAGIETGVQIAVPEIYQKELQLPPTISIPMPSLIKAINESSTGNSSYWAGLCQFERGEVGAALITLGSYRRRLPKGEWVYPSLINEAIGHLIRDNQERAIKALTLADQPDNPERLRVQLMQRALQQ